MQLSVHPARLPTAPVPEQYRYKWTDGVVGSWGQKLGVWMRGATRDKRVSEAIEHEERSGVVFTFAVRSAALVAVAAWLLATVPFPRVSWWLGLVALFFVSGLVPVVMRRRRRWHLWVGAFVVVDAAVLAVALLAPNPFVENPWPIQMQLRFFNHLYLFVFLAGAALTYSPLLVLWSGVAAAGAWSVGVWHIANRPESVLDSFDPPVAGVAAPTQAEALESVLSPTFVSLATWQNEVVLLLIVALITAAAVWRARRLVRRQVMAERARGNLARYFSPALVDRLADDRTPLEHSESRQAAVLFVDIVGFASLSEGLAPAQAIAILRSFHRRMAQCVFAHQGTIDKFIGDGVMATFGTLGGGFQDSSNALDCARAMLQQVERWNAKRARRGAAPVGIGIGLHCGPVVVGNVGGDQQLEFTVVGDTVNCASRIERLTREQRTPLLVSEAVMDAAREEGRLAPDGFADFERAGRVALRGRQSEVIVWRLRNGGERADVSAA